MTAADRPSVTDNARADEVPRLSIEDGYLVARVDRCTCEPHYGAHEIHCGIVDHHRLDNLPGWPGRAETTTATTEAEAGARALEQAADEVARTEAERDALAARLAAVEALLGRWHEYADPADLHDDLRAALAAPTDTTKETP